VGKVASSLVLMTALLCKGKTMHRVLLLGAGKIGRAIASFLHRSGDYLVTVADVSPVTLAMLIKQTPITVVEADLQTPGVLTNLLSRADSVISALSFTHNAAVAKAAVEAGCSYFDLTEDVETTRAVRLLADRCPEGCILMPQCGLAPGFISIAANDLASRFDSLDTVHMRVGALPLFPTNRLKYNLTWSTDGLINEYCNPCEAIHDGHFQEVLPMEGYESFSLDGDYYEAFNTSGGLGTLAESYAGRVRELNYRTVRYPGHCELMRFLLHDLRLSERREVLKQVLEASMPVTYQDVVITFVSVAGMLGGQLMQINDARKIYHQNVGELHWGAIQLTTAASICAAVDLHVNGKLPRMGFVRQEQISLSDFLENRFGQVFKQHSVEQRLS
jgi:saccharopine dehydrogenase-like NADP-dependent oxidoreductase